MEEWITVVERLGISTAIVVAVLVAVAWIGRRVFGERGLVQWVANRLCGDEGLVTRVAQAHLSLLTALEKATVEEAVFQAEVRREHVEQAERGTRVCHELGRIGANQQLFRDAGLHGCALLANVEAHLKAQNPAVSFQPELERIRTILERIGAEA